jgi:hypothetical protein
VAQLGPRLEAGFLYDPFDLGPHTAVPPANAKHKIESLKNNVNGAAMKMQMPMCRSGHRFSISFLKNVVRTRGV